MEPVTRIPKERIAVLIGKGGATRKMIEDAVGVKIHIDSESGESLLHGPKMPILFTE